MVLYQRRLMGFWGGEAGNRNRNRQNGRRYHRTQRQRARSRAGARIVRTAAVAAVPAPRALKHPGGSAHGSGERCRVSQRGTLPSQGKKQYPYD